MPSSTVDTVLLAQAVRRIAREIRGGGGPERFVVAGREGRRIATLLVKRTYRVHRGRCELAAPAQQLPVCLVDVPYADLPPPQVSPLIAVDESGALKPRTDVIVQAAAHTYASGVNRAKASFRIGDLHREVVVHGDRVGEVDAVGRYRFSEASPFEVMPIRWDRAYGGFDLAEFRRRGRTWLEETRRVRPEWGIESLTPFHYPRNPCGRGYVTRLTAESFEGLAVPNVEHPNDPLTPARLAVDGLRGWIRGPLPAGWDYVALGWFPRSGYLGLAPPHELGDQPLAEAKRGWVASDILATPSILRATSGGDVRLEAAQVAAPGLSVAKAPGPGSRVELEALHPAEPRFAFELPREVLRARIDLGRGAREEIPARLLTLVLRVPSEELEMSWGATFDVPEGLAPESLADAAREVAWVSPSSAIREG
jgi:hypothetical protein